MNWSVQHCVVSPGRNVRGHAADRLLRNHATPDRFHARIARFVAGEILLISHIMQDVQAKQRVTLTGETCLGEKCFQLISGVRFVQQTAKGPLFL